MSAMEQDPAVTYVNPTSVLATGIALPILGTIAVFGRFWVRWHDDRHYIWIDDWLCIPALVLVWAQGGLLIAGSATQTFGWHSPLYNSALDFIMDDEPRVVLLGKLQTAFDLIHPIVLALIKLSILYFYRRLFIGKIFKRVNTGTIIFVIAWAVAFIVAIAAACGTHVDANWGSLGQLKEQCVNTFNILIAYSSTDVAADLVIAATPVVMIFKLQMSLGRKVAASGAILVGCLSMACGITRMGYVIGADFHPLLDSPYVDGILATDDLGVVSFWVFWGFVEIGVGLVAICLPSLRPLLKIQNFESLMHSVQSRISLHSLRSSNKDGSSTRRRDGVPDTGKPEQDSAGLVASSGSLKQFDQHSCEIEMVGSRDKQGSSLGGQA